jgi:hypothetical protein
VQQAIDCKMGEQAMAGGINLLSLASKPTPDWRTLLSASPDHVVANCVFVLGGLLAVEQFVIVIPLSSSQVRQTAAQRVAREPQVWQGLYWHRHVAPRADGSMLQGLLAAILEAPASLRRPAATDCC